MSEPPGSYDICPLCGWEDDHVQLANPRTGGGANQESLVEAQAVALKRFPLGMLSAEEFERDPSWRPLHEEEQPLHVGAPRTGEEYFHAATADSVGYYWKK